VILNGERPKLDELRRTDDFEKLSMRLMRLFTGYGVIPASPAKASAASTSAIPR
jgi:hypothetical protein